MLMGESQNTSFKLLHGSVNCHCNIQPGHLNALAVRYRGAKRNCGRFSQLSIAQSNSAPWCSAITWIGRGWVLALHNDFCWRATLNDCNTLQRGEIVRF